jgi:hypothetical protein
MATKGTAEKLHIRLTDYEKRALDFMRAPSRLN